AFGFRQLKLKGGVLASRAECECMLALDEAFPGVGLTIDPNAAWTLDEAMRALRPLREKLAYAEDPCGAEPGLTAVQAMAEFRRSTSIPVASNMIATDLAGLLDAVREDAIDIPLADCHFWTLRGAAMVAQLCHAWGLTWGSHSNNHFDVSLAMMTHVAAAAPGNPAPIDTHWIWQTGQRLTREPLAIRDGRIRVPEGPGLGVEIDMAQVEEAHRLYRSLGLAGRDDAIVMRDLVPGWRFDPKRPCLVR
ncbi:MAG: glucarate dehydratase, partial [Xanthomonadales bacterium]|nr:glucarate dehydratase [Xanthomonadales bacterium]NIX12858.1 glucarate dehydratase [Xanthomonadales bacterium]